MEQYSISALHERDPCINNIKLNSRRTRAVDHQVQNQRGREGLQRGSLENVSTNPWGDPHGEDQSTLRRSRSLAITRGDVFGSLDVTTNPPRRSQLIPRAKLIEKPQRHSVKAPSVENLQEYQPFPADFWIIPPDYSPLSHRSSLLKEPEALYSSINNLASPKFIIGTESGQESNYQKRKPSYKEIQGLSLPNYYPDPKYDTDNTDAISIADDLSSSGDNNSKKYSSCDNISVCKWNSSGPEAIPYDDNIVLSANRPLYDSIRENHYAKPKTIRGPTPYNNDNPIYYRDKVKSYSSESSVEKEPVEEEISLEYFETDTNLDEINLSNENIDKFEESEREDDEDRARVIEVIEEELYEPIRKLEIKTIEVEAPPIEESQEYKTIVTVDPDLDTDEEKNKHSHNYLREFLETQKGSKKPLQNFITKKLTNLSRKSSNLIDNRFYSLPDLAVGKSLKKCEKIDQKLRKCGKKSVKKVIEPNESRFIVNIGKHFDITANANVPVDFELKIAKIPRKNKTRSKKNKEEEEFLKAVKNLKATLGGTLDENHNITKPEIVGFQEKMDKECAKEYQEKLGTMRNYWDKMVNPNSKSDDNKCKIVDVQTKVEDVKKRFEPEEKEIEKPSKVQITKQLFEKKPIEKTEKLSPFIKETCTYFEKSKKDCYKEPQYESLNPNTIELVSGNDDKQEKNPKPQKFIYPEFDHVRYKVVKSNLFQKKIFANCEKESQFDGLMQYLQDYSFQELLRDNNIVIIEPIRSKIPFEQKIKVAQNFKVYKENNEDEESESLKRHFFYHPIRVNKEVNDDELPNPETVKQARQFFEKGVKRWQSSQEVPRKFSSKTVDPDKDHCSGTDSNNSTPNFGSDENIYDSVTCCGKQYVSEDILEKIRECGTTVTYYGGRVVKKQNGQPILTKTIMEEIENDQKRTGDCLCGKDSYQGVKFRLLKSNSCNSRLELVGTNDLKEAKQKYLLQKEKTLKEIENNNVVNEAIKISPPKIIAEERKMTQWGDMKERTYNGINFNNKSKTNISFDYTHYDTIKPNIRSMTDMEFEQYEVA